MIWTCRRWALCLTSGWSTVTCCAGPVELLHHGCREVHFTCTVEASDGGNPEQLQVLCAQPLPLPCAESLMDVYLHHAGDVREYGVLLMEGTGVPGPVLAFYGAEQRRSGQRKMSEATTLAPVFDVNAPLTPRRLHQVPWCRSEGWAHLCIFLPATQQAFPRNDRTWPYPDLSFCFEERDLPPLGGPEWGTVLRHKVYGFTGVGI